MTDSSLFWSTYEYAQWVYDNMEDCPDDDKYSEDDYPEDEPDEDEEEEI